MKNRKLSKRNYYILSCTWGILVTLAGLLVSVVMLVIGKKPKKNMYGWYFTCGSGWGGFNIGPCSIVCEDHTQHVLKHEFGHSIQNCMYGPAMIVLVIIPSICRYWYRELFDISSPPYDSIWFEGMATRLGCEYYDALNKEDSDAE